ncbi:plasmid encoded RepA protein [Azospirillum argentinense]|uniref:replication protein RepA n=1 Tax=Azospirillum argentinense TaxID=2970906 RepID=UPI0032DECFAC
MADIHHLVRTHGRDEARRLVDVKDRTLVDIAAAVLEDESKELGITYSGFCLTALPHKKLPDDQEWTRKGHKVTLVVQPGFLPAGRNKEPKKYGVPYGSRARLILLYLQTQAVQNNSPEVELGRSMNDWLERMGLSNGGQAYKDVREQANRLSACNLTFMWDEDNDGAGFEKDSIIKGGGLRLHTGDPSQPRLWTDKIRLSPTFYTALRDHPVPIWEPALKHIANQSMAIDLYIWLAYRLHHLSRPTPVSWAALHAQFGANYSILRQFKYRFVDVLKMALVVYPEAVVTEDANGLVLHPSPPPIPEKQIAAPRQGSLLLG